MAYIRVKKVKGREYLYLVKSIWDGERKTSRQAIIKYLGSAARVKPEDIPEEYRGGAEVARFLESRRQDGQSQVEAAADLESRMYRGLTEGDLDCALDIYGESVRRLGSVESFFEMVLRPVLYEIGERWAGGRLDIATEHVASNVARVLVRMILDRNRRRSGKIKIMLCVPPGEEHGMGCDVIETYLRGRGFSVYNLGTPTPPSELASFVENNRPDLVMVSVSLDDNRKAAKRLVDRITSSNQVPVIVGGYAFRNGGDGMDGCQVLPDHPLRMLPTSIRRAIRDGSGDRRGGRTSAPKRD